MNFLKSFLKQVVIYLFAISLSLPASAANLSTTDQISLKKRHYEILTSKQEISSVNSENSAVASVKKKNNHKISIFAVNSGETKVNIFSNGKLLKSVNVFVDGIDRSQDSSENDLPSEPKHKKSGGTLSTLFPNEDISLRKVGNSNVLTGTVSSAEAAAQIVKVASQLSSGAEVVNLMKIRSEQQVMLRVRVGELKRDALGRLGLGLQGIISAGPTVLGSLERDQAFKTLAEPSLTAISGQSAKFLAGGEFPIPVSGNNGNISVTYKPFGVSVNFTPTVLNEKRIRLNVASEVSEITDVGSIQLNSMKVPAIGTRRANTTVELAPGESFMVAGLIRNDYNGTLNKVQGLGDIPVLGMLFKSSSFKRNESELVIAVTPYLVAPSAGEEIKLPTDNLVAPSTMDLMFSGKLGKFKNNQSQDNIKLEGPAGFLVD